MEAEKRLGQVPRMIYFLGHQIFGDHGAHALEWPVSLNPAGDAAFQGSRRFADPSPTTHSLPLSDSVLRPRSLEVPEGSSREITFPSPASGGGLSCCVLRNSSRSHASDR